MTNTFAAVLDALATAEGVSQGRMFGALGPKVSGKVFAMEVKGRLVVKLPARRVDELVAAGAERFDPGHGRPMREWVAVAPDAAWDWLDLAREALSAATVAR